MKNRFGFSRILMTMLAFALAAALLAPELASAAQRPRGKAVPRNQTGTVSLTLGRAGFILGGSGGQGVLHYRGRTYAFEMGGIGFGEFGGAKAEAVGDVYYLTRPEDFEGTYVQLQGGGTAIKGGGEIWLKNDKGVEMYLRTRTTGLELTLEASGIIVKFKDARNR